MRHLIIGSTGFLGRNLSRLLAAEGVAFDTLDRRAPAASAASRAFTFEEWPPDEYDAVHLLSAHVPARADAPSSRELIDANVRLPGQAVARFPGARLLFASSVSVYGRGNRGALDEAASHDGLTSYGYSKLAGETVCRSHANACVLRFSSIYGPGMKRDTFIPRIIDDALKKRRIVLFGAGTRRQNYLAVADAAWMLLVASASSAAGCFNAVAPKSHANLDVAQMVRESLPGTGIEHEGQDASPSADYDRRHWEASFGAVPETDLGAGIRQLVDFYSHGNA